MDSGKQHCKDIIQIEFWNNVNKKKGIVFRLEFVG